MTVNGENSSEQLTERGFNMTYETSLDIHSIEAISCNSKLNCSMKRMRNEGMDRIKSCCFDYSASI